MTAKNKKTSGFTLLTAIVVTSMLLLVSFVVADVALKQLVLTYSGQQSQYAFYNAETGVECAQYWDLKAPGASQFTAPSDSNPAITCGGQTISSDSEPAIPTAPLSQPSEIGGGAPATNVAVGQTATQSSTLGSGPVASLAVDDNTDGAYGGNSVTHTSNSAHEWWEVDLGSAQNISSVVVWNRTDCCSSRLGDYWIFISDTPFNSADTPTDLQGIPYAYHQTSAPNPSTAVSTPGAHGRYVRIQLSGTDYLSLAEVQVFGGEVQTSPNIFELDNLAGGGCAIVTVTKPGLTVIESRGYNTCNVNSDRRYERGIRIQY